MPAIARVSECILSHGISRIKPINLPWMQDLEPTYTSCSGSTQNQLKKHIIPGGVLWGSETRDRPTNLFALLLLLLPALPAEQAEDVTVFVLLMVHDDDCRRAMIWEMRDLLLPFYSLAALSDRSSGRAALLENVNSGILTFVERVSVQLYPAVSDTGQSDTTNDAAVAEADANAGTHPADTTLNVDSSVDARVMDSGEVTDHNYQGSNTSRSLLAGNATGLDGLNDGMQSPGVWARSRLCMYRYPDHFGQISPQEECRELTLDVSVQDARIGFTTLARTLEVLRYILESTSTLGCCAGSKLILTHPLLVRGLHVRAMSDIRVTLASQHGADSFFSNDQVS